VAMLRAVEHRSASDWPSGEATDSLTLDYDNRHRRRICLKTDAGAELLLDLPKAMAMAHGDGLRLEDGRWVGVKASPEALIEIRSDSTGQLARIAWHIGNRHLPAQIMEGAIRIRPDHVMEAMVAGLGGQISRLDAPFQPEGGAYAGGRQGHNNSHGQSHSHDHAGHHPHDHDHAHHHGHGHHNHPDDH
jgi:urease accessory protein